MSAPVSKPKTASSPPKANALSSRVSSTASAFRFTDLREETVTQTNFQQLANSFSASNAGTVVTQRKEKEENPLQKKEAPAKISSNNTGLPGPLKSGIENLSGYSMDDVKVHYNSPKPAALQAHAYAQGTYIHLAAGQEKHLAHEAWHVVQQKQGRVRPTVQLKGIHVNDNVGLEKEADVMGAKALQSSGQTTKVPLVSKVAGAVLQGNFWGQALGVLALGLVGAAVGPAVGAAVGATAIIGATGSMLAGAAAGAWAGSKVGGAVGDLAEKHLKSPNEQLLDRQMENQERDEGEAPVLNMGGRVYEEPRRVAHDYGDWKGERDEYGHAAALAREEPEEENVRDERPQWRKDYEAFENGPTWVQRMDQIKELLSLQEENIASQEDLDGPSKGIEAQKAKVQEYKAAMEEKEQVLIDLTQKKMAANRIKGLYYARQINTHYLELGEDLNGIYAAFGIPVEDAGGSRSPRKFPAAEGTIYFYGPLELGEEPPARVRKTELRNERELGFELHDKEFYQLSYNGKLQNAAYVPGPAPAAAGKIRKGSDSLTPGEAAHYQDDFRRIALALDRSLDAPINNRKVTFTGSARRKDRGAGQQYKAMDDTNAAAYAFGSGQPGALGKNWEWLHIRGAGLGGETASTNLVAGTYSANSHMIPFENQLKMLSALSDGKHPLVVNWTNKPARGGKFNSAHIRISWTAPKGFVKNGKTYPPVVMPMTIDFNPVNGAAFDKFLNSITYEAYRNYLKQAR